MTDLPQPVRVRPTIVVLSHLRWDFVTQRPQHLMRRAASDYDVVFIEEPLVVDEQAAGIRRSAGPNGVQIVQPLLPRGTSAAEATDHQCAVVDTLVSGTAGQLVLWYYTPMALPFSRHIAADLIVFDKMDELSAFDAAPPLLLALEQQLLELADLVFTGGASMHDAAVGRHDNIHCFPSSIDTAHFAGARRHDLVDPADQSAIAQPRLGFFGVIDERFDVALVAELAALRPDLQLVLIGPVVKIDPASLPLGANLHWLGGKTYAELPAYLSGWDVGIMPFAINAATRFISPTKTPEFLAAGLPVVSTPIRDVVRPYGEAGLVEIAGTAAGFVEAIDTLLSRPRDCWLRKVDAQLGLGSWDRTWQGMRAEMDKILTGDVAATPNREIEHV